MLLNLCLHKQWGGKTRNHPDKNYWRRLGFSHPRYINARYTRTKSTINERVYRAFKRTLLPKSFIHNIEKYKYDE